MTSTLTERYISTAMGNIPSASRDDVQAELDVSIADAIDSRIAQGEGRSDAERAVLTELGDPRVLAAGYSDRPLHLIGPRYYLTWWRLLRLLWVIVPISAMGAVALGQTLADAPVGEIIGTSIAIGISVFMHVSFWVTLVFVVLERTGNGAALQAWSIDQLPEIRLKGTRRGDMIASLVVFAVGTGAVLWDQFPGLVIHGGKVFPFLNPGLWPWWITGLVVLMATQTALVIAVYIARRWTVIFAVINTTLAIVFASFATGLLVTGHLVNPEFISAVFTDNGVRADTIHTLALIAGVGIIGFSAWGIIDGWLKTFRDNRA